MQIKMFVDRNMNYFKIIPEKKQDQNLITNELYQLIFHNLEFTYINDIIKFYSKHPQIKYFINNQEILIDFSLLPKLQLQIS